ncbi:SID1 transmembrane family member 2 isoform X1 [Agrilus planipennis]|uniref:SID1 transmembrane family member 2 isoform X1 n=1 Tax=Agrilus planipennis TaxID=224129 RepID=A0A1W4XF31_AGRPL|nr:SID1 transmembrane family member 2 isoform X1 [Agrilus planipennis]
MCYYNFLCANPLFGMTDFNHIFSNVGYIFVGILFLFLVYIKDKWEIYKPSHGIPMHSGMYYAMGIALIIEGILSACYHICPNQANFQFDTSFMYVLAVLWIIKLYQKRHPDINAVAYATFLVLGIAIFMATIGIVDGSLSIWILFMVSYIIFCVYLSFNAYFLSYVRHGLMSVFKDCTKPHDRFFNVFKPRRRAHFIICLLGNIINSVMALLGIYCYSNGIDFGTFLLVILLGNATLYCLSYTSMKLTHGERICAQAIFFGILTLITWGFSAYFFTQTSTLWYVSPAESRQRNTNCQFLNFYDYHDIWHLLSAAALLFTFVFLMVIDDDLKHKPHYEISVF